MQIIPNISLFKKLSLLCKFDHNHGAFAGAIGVPNELEYPLGNGLTNHIGQALACNNSADRLDTGAGSDYM